MAERRPLRRLHALERRGLDRLAMAWYRHGAVVLAAGAVASLVLGFWGWTTYLDGTGEETSVTSRAYLTLQLFGIESGGVSGDIPLALDIARFLAPLVLATAAISAAVALLQRQLSRFRARRARRHVIVAGLGERGGLLAQRLRAEGHTVVALEAHEANPHVASARRGGIAVLADDATDPQALLDAGLARADHLVATCGDDATNAAVASSVLSLQREGLVPPDVASYVRIGDAAAARTLQGWLDPERARYRQEFFNDAERGSRVVADRLDRLAEPGPATLVVIGTSDLAASVVVEVARRRRARTSDHGADGVLQIALVGIDGADPTACLARAESWYPPLPEPNVEVDGLRLELSTSASDEDDVRQAGWLPRAGETTTPGAVVVTLREPTAQLRVAAEVRRVVPRGWLVVVATEHSGGLPSLLTGDAALAQLEVVSLPDVVYHDELIVAGRLEALARAIHAGYLRSIRSDLDPQQRAERPANRPWADLDAAYRRQNVAAAQALWSMLAAQGYRIVPHHDPDAERRVLPDDELERLAAAEHERWFTAKHPGRAVPDWGSVAPDDQALTRAQVAAIPGMLVEAGLQLEPDPSLRSGASASPPAP